jgi:hypothetical protein
MLHIVGIVTALKPTSFTHLPERLSNLAIGSFNGIAGAFEPFATAPFSAWTTPCGSTSSGSPKALSDPLLDSKCCQVELQFPIFRREKGGEGESVCCCLKQRNVNHRGENENMGLDGWYPKV